MTRVKREGNNRIRFYMFFNKRKNILKRIEKANELFDVGRKDEAFKEMFSLQNEFPRKADVLFALAILFNPSAQQELAIDTLKNVLAIKPDHKNTKVILPTVIYEYAVQ